MATECMRTLDKVTATMDAMSLNNLMVCMRSLVRRVKVHVIHKMTHQIKMYRSKKGTEEQKAENCRKADRLVAEIQVIRNLNLDRVSKFALHNTLTIRDIKPQTDQEQKALLRLACQKAMDQHVTKWRAEHEDWKSLSAFLLTKTGRRLKRKKKKKSGTKPPQAKKRKTKETTDVLNNSNASSDPSDNDDQTHIETIVEEHALEKESKNIQLAVSNKPTRKSKKHIETIVDEHQLEKETKNIELPVSNKQTRKCKKLKTSKILNEIDTTENQLKHDSTVSCKVAKEFPQDSGISDMDTAKVEAVIPNTVQQDRFIVEQDSSHSTDNLSSTNIVKSKQTSEMVVQRINLEDLGDDADSFFVLPGEPAEKDTAEDTKPADDVTEDIDSFFVFGGKHSHIATSEPHLEEDSEPEDREGSLACGREMMSSTFIGALCHPRKEKRLLKKSDIRKRPAWDEKKFLKDGSRNKNSATDKPKNLKFGSDRAHKDMTKWKGADVISKNKQLQSTQIDEAHAPRSTEALHPSWEASRKRKQQQIGIPSFQGKKTTFDDSD